MRRSTKEDLFAGFIGFLFIIAVAVFNLMMLAAVVWVIIKVLQATGII